jgi:hypothetical protein
METTTIANSALPNKQDVFGASISDFDPWDDDDFGGDGFGDFAPPGGSTGNDFFKDDFTSSSVSLAQSEGTDPSQHPPDESERENSTSNHNSIALDLTSPSRSGRSERSRPSSSRRLSSKTRSSSDDPDPLAAMGAASEASEGVDALERRAPERKHSSGPPGPRRPPRDDAGGGEEGVAPRSRAPPMRRRSSNRRAMLEGIAPPPHREPRSKSSDRVSALPEGHVEEAPEDIDKDNEIAGQGRRGMMRSQRNSFRVKKRGNMEKETDQVKESENEKETLDNTLPERAPARRASVTSSGHKQLSSRRLTGAVVDGKSISTQTSLHNLFREEETKEAEADTATAADDASAVIVSRSVLKRTSSRRGNLGTSINNLSSPSGKSATNTSTSRMKMDGEHTGQGGRPAPDRRCAPQRSTSALVSPGSSVTRREPQRLPPSRSTSMTGVPNSQRRLQSRSSQDVKPTM